MTEKRSAPEPSEAERHQAEPHKDEHSEFDPPEGDLSLRVGRKQIDIDSRWEAASILNDMMTGLWFVIGSILNLLDVAEMAALVFYLVGSTQLLARAVIRLARRVHVWGGYSRSRPRAYRPDVDD